MHKNKKIVLSFVIIFIFTALLSRVHVYNSILNPFDSSNKSYDFYDLYYKYFQVSRSFEDPDIVLFNIEDKSRAEIIESIKIINAAQPKLISINIFINSPELDSIIDHNISRYVLAYDTRAISQQHNVDGINYGHVQLAGKDNITARQFLTSIKDHSGRPIRSLGQIIASKYLRRKPIELPSEQYIHYSVDMVKSAFSPLTSKKDYFLTLDADLIEDNFQSLSKRIRNKIVLIGVVDNSICIYEDRHYTPYNNKLFSRSFPDMSSTQIHANIIRMLLDDKIIKQVPSYIQIILSIVIIYILLRFIHVRNLRSSGFDIISKSVFALYAIFLVISSMFLFRFYLLRLSLDLFLVPVLFSETAYSMADKLIEIYSKKIKNA